MIAHYLLNRCAINRAIMDTNETSLRFTQLAKMAASQYLKESIVKALQVGIFKMSQP